MIERSLKTSVRCLMAVVFCTTVGLAAASAQQPIRLPASSDNNNEDVRVGSIEEEMRVKRAIKAADKAHQDNVERARDLASLSVTLLQRFTQNNCFDRDDFKKLDKAEKLAKGIREAAGGSEDRTEISEAPANVESALRKFSELAESLKQRVEKTPKHVVSAAVIDQANVLLELIRMVRTMHPKA
jgi:hypothetical protein